jgi:hypothetical protein
LYCDWFNSLFNLVHWNKCMNEETYYKKHQRLVQPPIKHKPLYRKRYEQTYETNLHVITCILPKKACLCCWICFHAPISAKWHSTSMKICPVMQHYSTSMNICPIMQYYRFIVQLKQYKYENISCYAILSLVANLEVVTNTWYKSVRC